MTTIKTLTIFAFLYDDQKTISSGKA